MVCWQNSCGTRRREKKPYFAAFADFHSWFQLPTRYYWTLNWEATLAISIQELEQAGPRTLQVSSSIPCTISLTVPGHLPQHCCKCYPRNPILLQLLLLPERIHHTSCCFTWLAQVQSSYTWQKLRYTCMAKLQRERQKSIWHLLWRWEIPPNTQRDSGSRNHKCPLYLSRMYCY